MIHHQEAVAELLDHRRAALANRVAVDVLEDVGRNALEGVGLHAGLDLAEPAVDGRARALGRQELVGQVLQLAHHGLAVELREEPLLLVLAERGRAVLLLVALLGPDAEERGELLGRLEVGERGKFRTLRRDGLATDAAAFATTTGAATGLAGRRCGFGLALALFALRLPFRALLLGLFRALLGRGDHLGDALLGLLAHALAAGTLEVGDVALVGRAGAGHGTFLASSLAGFGLGFLALRRSLRIKPLRAVGQDLARDVDAGVALHVRERRGVERTDMLFDLAVENALDLALAGTDELAALTGCAGDETVDVAFAGEKGGGRGDVALADRLLDDGAAHAVGQRHAFLDDA